MATKFKQKKKNGFSIFLEEYVEAQRSSGRKISNRIGAEECALLWEQMPPEEKQAYIDKASIYRVYTQEEKETKFTTLGLSFAEMDRKEAVEKMKIEKGNREIETTIGNLNWDTIRNHLFYIIHCHYLVKLEDGVYVPGEIAICEFNLEDGIKKTYHRLINSGPLPIGYGYEAKLRRETVHDLPVPPYEEGVSDFCEILNDIFKFIEPGRDFKGKRPPFYAIEDDIGPIENILQQFSNKVGQGENFFRVLPIHKLFFSLKNKCADLANNEMGAFPVLTNAMMEIEKDTYRYVSGISCQYHISSDQFYHSCSLSVVQRYVYLICDHCCHLLKIPLKPGKHIRKNADIRDEDIPEEETPMKPNIQIKEEKPWFEDEKPDNYWNHFTDSKEEFVMDSKNFPQLPHQNRSTPNISNWRKPNRQESWGRGKRFQK